jgi:hypothetical protein
MRVKPKQQRPQKAEDDRNAEHLLRKAIDNEQCQSRREAK